MIKEVGGPNSWKNDGSKDPSLLQYGKGVCFWVAPLELIPMDGDFVGGFINPYLGKISNLTSMFQTGWNHQLGCFYWNSVVFVEFAFKEDIQFVGKDDWSFIDTEQKLEPYSQICPQKKTLTKIAYIFSSKGPLSDLAKPFGCRKWQGVATELHLFEGVYSLLVLGSVISNNLIPGSSRYVRIVQIHPQKTHKKPKVQGTGEHRRGGWSSHVANVPGKDFRSTEDRRNRGGPGWWRGGGLPPWGANDMSPRSGRLILGSCDYLKLVLFAWIRWAKIADSAAILGNLHQFLFFVVQCF